MLLIMQFFHRRAGRSRCSQYVCHEACTVTELNKLLRLTVMSVSSNQLVSETDSIYEILVHFNMTLMFTQEDFVAWGNCSR